jgi:hypothetical protein
MCGTVVFCSLVGMIGVAGAPEVLILLLRFAASKPMESHVYCFCLPGLDVVVHNA